MTRLLTAKQVAERCNINRATVYDLAKEGLLPGIRLGGVWRFDETQLEEYLRNQTTVPVAGDPVLASWQEAREQAFGAKKEEE